MRLNEGVSRANYGKRKYNGAEMPTEQPDRAETQVDAIIAYESGEMHPSDVVPFVQSLIDNGLAWSLQGSYGRLARACIDAGECHQ